jgi:hypothetical protein
MTEWRPITDEQRNGETILVFVPSHGVSRIAWYCEETGLWPSDDEGPYTSDGEPCNVGYPTHYKPLGPPPEDAT